MSSLSSRRRLCIRVAAEALGAAALTVDVSTTDGVALAVLAIGALVATTAEGLGWDEVMDVGAAGATAADCTDAVGSGERTASGAVSEGASSAGRTADRVRGSSPPMESV